MWVYDAALETTMGPYTSRDIRSHGELWFPPIAGDELDRTEGLFTTCLRKHPFRFVESHDRCLRIETNEWFRRKARAAAEVEDPSALTLIVDLESLGAELMQPYFDECRACLADGVVADRDALDAGMIFGTGFAPFRGGPMFYLEQVGQEQVSQEVEEKGNE